MDTQLRIAFTWLWQNDPYQLMTWRDGLYAALRELKKRGHVLLVLTHGKIVGEVELPDFTVQIRPEGEATLHAVEDFKPDVVLSWCDMTRPDSDVGHRLGLKTAACFAGGNPFGETLRHFDHIFVESEVYRQRFQAAGISVSTAFGTNTQLFDPGHKLVKGQQKVFDVCFPATYAQWKRHKKFAEAVRGFKAVACGYMYTDHETDCWEVCQDAGILTLPHVSADTLCHLYAASKCCLITSDSSGGSQRTVLEAMAMNVPVIVMQDSDKCSEYVLDAGLGFVSNPDPIAIRVWLEDLDKRVSDTRSYIRSKWSEYHYADALEKGLCSLVS